MRGSVPAVPVYVHACGATQLMFGSCTCMCSVNTGCVCTRVRAAQVVDVDVHMCGAKRAVAVQVHMVDQRMCGPAQAVPVTEEEAKRAVAVQVHMVDQRMCGPAQAVPVTEVSCSCVTTQARLVQACMVVRVRSGIGVLANTLHISLVHAPAVPVHGHVCGAAQLGDVCVQWCVHACGATQLMFGSCTCMGSVNNGCVCTRVRAAQVVDVYVHMCGAKRDVAMGREIIATMNECRQ